jgi:hypothetical protein
MGTHFLSAREKTTMPGCHLDLTPEEHGLLVRVLSTELKETRAEQHHTEFSVEMQEEVKKEEALLRSLLQKLQMQPVA